MLHFLLFLACSSPQPIGKDSGSTGTDNTTDSSTDSGTTDTHVCNEDNEDCDVNVGGCGGEGIDMLPGANCLNCHTRGGDREAPTFTAAGTVFVDKWGTKGASGVTVRITDKNGNVYEEKTGRAGSFVMNDNIVFPAKAEVESSAGTMKMGEDLKTGACNSCHSCTGSKGEKLYAQQ